MGFPKSKILTSLETLFYDFDLDETQAAYEESGFDMNGFKNRYEGQFMLYIRVADTVTKPEHITRVTILTISQEPQFHYDSTKRWDDKTEFTIKDLENVFYALGYVNKTRRFVTKEY